jgi:hypothetical protein
MAVYLATRGESPEIALRLAKEELRSRGDVFTHDAYAWSLAAAGRLTEAQREMELALNQGTEDGRLFFHAALLESRCGNAAASRKWQQKAIGLGHLLLPSERDALRKMTAQDTNSGPGVTAKGAQGFFTLANEASGEAETETKASN